MEDGDIDYSRYTACEIREALAGIRRDVYPKNHANLLAALAALAALDEREPDKRAPVSPASQEVAPEPAPDGTLFLASRGSRLGASLIDGLILTAILFPIEYVQGLWQTLMDAARNHELIPLSVSLPWVGFAALMFLLVQGFPLVRDGQTWGKKALSIRIIDQLDGKPSIQRLAVRCGVAMFVRLIPFVGRFANLVDICLISRADKRCGHDLISGTRVVEVTR